MRKLSQGKFDRSSAPTTGPAHPSMPQKHQTLPHRTHKSFIERKTSKFSSFKVTTTFLSRQPVNRGLEDGAKNRDVSHSESTGACNFGSFMLTNFYPRDATIARNSVFDEGWGHPTGKSKSLGLSGPLKSIGSQCCGALRSKKSSDWIAVMLQTGRYFLAFYGIVCYTDRFILQ